MSKALDVLSETDNMASGEESGGEITWSRSEFEKYRVSVQALRKKRIQSASFSNSGVNGLTINGVPSDIQSLTSALHRSHVTTTRCLYGKNSKKSRDGRRIPSKRGGKNVQNPTDVLDEIELDHDDPDYDSDLEDPVTLEAVQPVPSDEEFECVLTSIVNEFFVHGKTQEVIDSLVDFNMVAHQRRRIPYLIVTMALQHKQTQCELASELLSDLCNKVINHAHIQHGLALVLNELGELTIDFPKASEHVGRFIARAMADDILPPKFIETQKLVLSHYPLVHCHGDGKNVSVSSPTTPIDTPTVPGFTASGSSLPDRGPKPYNLHEGSSSVDNSCVETTPSTCGSSGIGSASSLTTATKPEIALKALNRAETLLTLSHAFARLDNIWGIPVGPRATELLKKKVQGLMKAYLDSSDLTEATEALLELDSPHFRHELVFQAIVGAIELSTDDARERVIRLLQELCRSGVITTNQLELGIRRVYDELSDLQLDVPAAYVLMERFLAAGHSVGFVSKKLMNEMPKKIRKRFISETDNVHRSRKKHQLL